MIRVTLPRVKRNCGGKGLDPVEQGSGWDFEGLGQLHDVPETDITLAALYASDIITVDPG